MPAIRNITASLTGYIVALGLGLVFTPYLVNQLGVAAYGLVPLVTSLFVWGTWVSLAVNWSVGRYVTIAVANGDTNDAAAIFNTSLVASLVLGCIILMGGVALAPIASTSLRLPTGTEQAVRVLVVLGSIATGFGVISGVVEVAFYALNRLDIRAIFQVARALGSVAAVLLLFTFDRPRLEWVGAGACISACLASVVAYYWGKTLVPALTFSPSLFSVQCLGMMMKTNIWIVVDQLGTIMMLNVSLLLVNALFGPAASAEYGLAVQWENMLRSGMTAMTVFTPQYLVFVARADITGLRDIAIRASRFVSLSIGLLGGVVVGLHEWLPKIWLHRQTTLLGPLMVGLLTVVVINAAANPLYGVWQAMNRVKVPSLATLAAGLLSVFASLLLARITPLGPWSVVIGTGLGFTLRNVLFSFWYVGRLIEVPALTLIRSVLIGVGTFVTISTTEFAVARWLRPDGWIGAALVAVLALALAIPLIGALFVQRDEYRKVVTVWATLAGRGKTLPAGAGD